MGGVVGGPELTGTIIALACRSEALCTVLPEGRGVSFADGYYQVLYHLPGPLKTIAWTPPAPEARVPALYLATVHYDGSWSLWNITPARPLLLRRTPVADTALTALDVSTESWIATETGGEITIVAPDGWVRSSTHLGGGGGTHLQFDPSGRLAAINGDGGLLRVESDREEPRTARVDASPERVAWFVGGTIVVSAASQLFLWPPDNDPYPVTPLLDDRTQTIGAAIRDPGGVGFIYSRSDGALIRQARGGAASLLVPLEQSADRLSALSLDLSPDEGWLVASRADDEVRVFDLAGEEPPVSLPLRTNDSKTVAFSPDMSPSSAPTDCSTSGAGTTARPRRS